MQDFTEDDAEEEEAGENEVVVIEPVDVIAAEAITPVLKEKHVAKKRVPTYHEARVGRGAELTIFEEVMEAEGSVAEKAFQDAIAADATAPEEKADEDKPTDSVFLEETPQLQEAEKEAVAKFGELQASEVDEAANVDATASDAVATEQEEPKQTETKKRKPGNATPLPKRSSTRLRSGVTKK